MALQAVRPADMVPLPTTKAELLAMRSIKSQRSILDYVEDVHQELLDEQH